MNQLLLSILPMLTVAQAQESVVLYRPGLAIKDQAISLRSWGSGICSETQEAAFQGTTSIRISTKNLFQGGTLIYGKPIDLAPMFGDKANLLRLTYRSLDAGGSSGGVTGGKGGGGLAAPGGGVGASAGPPGGALGGGRGPGGGGATSGPPGGFGGQGRPGQDGGLGASASAPPLGGTQSGGATVASGTSLKTMRIIITTTDGLRSETYLAANTAMAGQDGWRQAGIPLQSIKGFERTNKIIKDISFAGDVSTAFFIGDMRVVSDRTPISATTNFREMLCNVGDNVTFTASGTAGSSILKYSWDFDDMDGIQVDAEGASVTNKFRTASNDLTAGAREGGVFKVTLTVTDVFGLKDPYVLTIKVKVNP